jgi:hypothetical protein
MDDGTDLYARLFVLGVAMLSVVALTINIVSMFVSESFTLV